MGRQVKFSGTVLETSGPVLRGELETDYSATPGAHVGYDRAHHVVLYFGDHELARFDVTGREAEWQEQPGDYWDQDARDNHEEAFVEQFLGEKLAAVFGNLEGAVKP